MNSSAGDNWVYLAHYLAWPAVVLIAVVLFRDSIGQLLEKLPYRPIKFSKFKVQFELGKLSQSRLEGKQLTALAAQFANESYPAQISDSIRVAAKTSYLVVDLGSGDEKRGLTSRLFVFAAILERIRTLRCLVFVSGAAPKSKFIGAATPRNVRWSIGVWSRGWKRPLRSATAN
jgi:hypothetical protein